MNQPEKQKKTSGLHPFRRAVLRGLGIVLPPLLTIVVFLWAWTLIESYVLVPVETGARYVLVFVVKGDDIYESVPADLDKAAVLREGNRVVRFRAQGKQFVQVPSGEWIPEQVYLLVQKDPGDPAPKTGLAFYQRYVSAQFLRRTVVVPVFLSVFILVLYVIGKLMAAGAGRFLWNSFEALIRRLPVIRNVYSSVKQVTDFVFTEQEIEFNRVVAVEYPRKGVWSIGFVTGESMLDIRSAANQPVLSVLMPTSPMPMTGFTITVLKSETVDLNVTIDQAIQFVVSCGVVIPAQQLQLSQKEKNLVVPAPERDANSNGESSNGEDRAEETRVPRRKSDVTDGGE